MLGAESSSFEMLSAAAPFSGFSVVRFLYFQEASVPLTQQQHLLASCGLGTGHVPHVLACTRNLCLFADNHHFSSRDGSQFSFCISHVGLVMLPIFGLVWFCPSVTFPVPGKQKSGVRHRIWRCGERGLPVPCSLLCSLLLCRESLQSHWAEQAEPTK